MSSRRSVRQLVVAVLLGVLVGGGLMAVTPAGAEVSNAVATNWKKVWKKHLRPLADRRYYTKAQSDAKYQPKGSYETAGSGYSKAETYSKAEADAKYSAAGSAYSKAEADARFARAPQVIRGTFAIRETSSGAEIQGTQISWDINLAGAPTTHYIPSGDPLPAECSGTPFAPSAIPGHLCVFEGVTVNANFTGLFGPTAGGMGTMGGYIGYSVPAAGTTFAVGSWALGVSTLSAGSPAKTSPSSIQDPAALGN